MIVHNTMDGKQMLVIEMEDGHLLNMIGYVIKNLKIAKSILVEDNKNNFKNIIYGKKMDKFEAEQYIKNYEELISVYVLEAKIRGLNIDKHIDNLREILEREEQYINEFDMLFIEE